MLGTDLGSTVAVTIGRPDNKQNRCRTGEELIEKRFAISCYRDDVKKEYVYVTLKLIGYWRLK